MLKFGLMQDFRNRARTWERIPAKRAFFTQLMKESRELKTRWRREMISNS